jgi:tRNA (cmo5U34)-methyltransferase
LLNKISNRHKDKKIEFIGLDSIKAMINQTKKLNKNKTNIVKYLNKDILKFIFKNCDLIISYYTLQFVKPKYRQALINKIYKSLNWGGAFILFEKIRANDARFQDIYSTIYNDFKLKKGFSPSEIVFKARSLKGVLEPFSDFGNSNLLKRAGFVDYITVFQWMNFKGYLCIK